jgi:Bacterial Ig-like domain
MSKTVLVLASMALGLLLGSGVALAVSPYTPALAQSTAAENEHPRVIEVKPAEGATGVSLVGPSNPFVFHRVAAVFSEDMRPSSAMRAIKVFRKGSDTTITDYTISYNAQKRKVILEPEISLKRGATYKAVVSTRAKNLAGNRLDQKRNRAGLQRKVWCFTMED